MVLWRPTRLSRNNTPKRCPFHYRGLECKRRKSRNTLSNRKIWLWSTEWSRAKALIEFCQKNTLIIANTLFQQHKRRFYTWTSPDGQHQNQTDYNLCSQRWRNSIQSAKQDRELTVSQIMSSLWPNSDLNCRKYGKPLHHSGILNQIPFDYTVEVRNRFKGLDLIDRVPDELWTEVHDTV